MKTPSRPAPRPPSPLPNRAQVPVTPAPTLSHPLSALASRTCPMSDLTPLPSMAAARQMRRRYWTSSPAPRHSEGSQGRGGTLYVSEVAADNPALRWSALPPYSVIGLPGGQDSFSGVWNSWRSVIPTPSSLRASPADPLPGRRMNGQLALLGWAQGSFSRNQSQISPTLAPWSGPP